MAKTIKLCDTNIVVSDDMDVTKLQSMTSGLGIVKSMLLKTVLELLNANGLAICTKKSLE